MKASNILKLIKLPEGVELDLTQLDLTAVEEEWNRQYNGMKLNVGEEAVKGFLKEFNVTDKDGLQGLINANKTDADKSNQSIEKIHIRTAGSTETIQELQDKINAINTNLEKKEQELVKQNQFSLLRSFEIEEGKKVQIKDDRLEQAHHLISLGVTEDKDFTASAKEFVTKTPEWLVNDTKPSIQTYDTKTPPPAPTGDAKVDDFW